MKLRSGANGMKMYFLILLFQGACWSYALALPTMGVEPDYDIALPSLTDSTATPPSEIAYTFKTSAERQTTPEKMIYSETTPDDSYPWDDNKDIPSTTEIPPVDSRVNTRDYTDMIDSTMAEEQDETTAETEGTQLDEKEMADAPSSGKEEQRSGIIYRLFTRAHPLEDMILRNDSVEGTDFDVARSTVFLIHGFTGDTNSDSVTLIRDAVLWAEDANVVAVDWAPLAAGPNYDVAVNNTRAVAIALARRVEALAGAGLPLAQVHLVGFSLGAQVAGLAGGALRATAGRLPRITALDPARPGFHDVPEEQRLDAGDADFVQVLHTAAGLVSFEEPLGHVDFYANSGRSPQPACVAQLVHGTQERKLIDPRTVVCSHLIAPRYFAESIYKPTNFRSTRCRSWRDYDAGMCAGQQVAFMGLNTDPSTRGSFYFRTNTAEPYGRGATVDDSLGAGAIDGSDSDGDDDGDGNRLDGRTPRKQDLSDVEEPSTASGAPASAVASAAVFIVTAISLLRLMA